ncbi:MAG: hypothetical protein KBD01_07900 [Acidobacteria bacterium]|nr:hypothetical protein [Acidobacteriota bacterium]
MQDEPRDIGTEPEITPREDPALTIASFSDEDRLLLVFAYLGPLCLVPLLGSRDPFVRWHARQGAFLALAAALLMAVLSPFHWLFSMIPLLGRMFRVMEIFVGLGYLAVVAMAIERAVVGRRFRIPWISDLADQ